MDAEYLSTKLLNDTYANETMLNLGCGIGKFWDCVKSKNMLNVDIWTPYLLEIKHDISVIKADLRDLSMFVDKSWDAIMCIDVIEHLEKEQALQLLRECDRIARKRIIMYTPRGFHAQDDGQGWGAANPEYQKHRCGFVADEFKDAGYQYIYVFENIAVPSLYAVKTFGV